MYVLSTTSPLSKNITQLKCGNIQIKVLFTFPECTCFVHKKVSGVKGIYSAKPECTLCRICQRSPAWTSKTYCIFRVPVYNQGSTVYTWHNLLRNSMQKSVKKHLELGLAKFLICWGACPQTPQKRFWSLTYWHSILKSLKSFGVVFTQNTPWTSNNVLQY